MINLAGLFFDMNWIFGYGSLINRKTWFFDAHFEWVQIEGWVRQWCQIIKTPQGGFCALTISPNENSKIDGIIISTNLSTFSVIDKREAGYQKTIINESQISVYENKDTNSMWNREPVFAYTASKESFRWASEKSPILQTYIDVIADGFYKQFGMKGLLNFFCTTQGWELPILNDRDMPIYPRSIDLEPEFLSLVDQHVSANRARCSNLCQQEKLIL